MTIYLIRHGKTLANEQHLYCGSTDLSLSERGRSELRALPYPLFKARYLSSGMKRANETLQLLFPGVPFEIDSRFREVDFGIFEMGSYETLKDTPAYQAWITGDNDRNIPPQGESGAQMRARVLEAFSQIRQDTVILTHGGCIASIMGHLFPEEGKNLYQWEPTNGHGYAICGNRYWPIPEQCPRRKDQL